MKDPVFEIDNWEPLFPIDDETAVDADGHFRVRLDDGVVMDPDTGRISFTTPWHSGDASEPDPDIDPDIDPDDTDGDAGFSDFDFSDSDFSGDDF